MPERWSGLSADEMLVLDAIFWSSGGSRHGMAERLAFSKSKANALIAGLVDQGILLGFDIGATSLDIAVPRPVDFQSSRQVDPPLMPALGGFSIRDLLREGYAAPVFVDNDVNLMALGLGHSVLAVDRLYQGAQRRSTAMCRLIPPKPETMASSARKTLRLASAP